MEGSDFTSKEIIKAFRLSEAEAMNLANSAACHGMKESNYIRKCIARGPKDNKEIVILLHDLSDLCHLLRAGKRAAAEFGYLQHNLSCLPQVFPLIRSTSGIS